MIHTYWITLFLPQLVVRASDLLDSYLLDYTLPSTVGISFLKFASFIPTRLHSPFHSGYFVPQIRFFHTYWITLSLPQLVVLAPELLDSYLLVCALPSPVGSSGSGFASIL